VATPKATLFGLRVPYRFTDVHAEVDSAVVNCTISTAESVTSHVGGARAAIALNGKDRSGSVQAIVYPLSGHEVSEFGEAKFYSCRVLGFKSGGMFHNVRIGDPDAVLLPAWAAASKGSVLSVDGAMKGKP
jgi:hypothetical protein